MFNKGNLNRTGGKRKWKNLSLNSEKLRIGVLYTFLNCGNKIISSTFRIIFTGITTKVLKSEFNL